MLLLQIERAGERDVAIEVPLVKLVEDDHADAAEAGIGEHLAQEHALGHEANARPGGADAVEPNLVPDFLAEPRLSLKGDARREHPRRQPPRLEDDDLASAGKAVIEEHLRNLRRFSGAGRGLEDEPGVLSQRIDQRGFELEDGKIAGIQSGVTVDR